MDATVEERYEAQRSTVSYSSNVGLIRLTASLRPFSTEEKIGMLDSWRDENSSRTNYRVLHRGIYKSLI